MTGLIVDIQIAPSRKKPQKRLRLKIQQSHKLIIKVCATTTSVTGAGHVVKADAKWTYSYANNAVPAGGVYGGGGVGNTGNGRVTYTATMP